MYNYGCYFRKIIYLFANIYFKNVEVFEWTLDTMYFKLKDSVFNSVEVKLAFLNIFVGKSKEDIKIR